MIFLGLTFRILQGSTNAAIYTITYSIFSINYEGGDFMKVNSVFKGTIGKFYFFIPNLNNMKLIK